MAAGKHRLAQQAAKALRKAENYSGSKAPHTPREAPIMSGMTTTPLYSLERPNPNALITLCYQGIGHENFLSFVPPTENSKADGAFHFYVLNKREEDSWDVIFCSASAHDAPMSDWDHREIGTLRGS